MEFTISRLEGFKEQTLTYNKILQKSIVINFSRKRGFWSSRTGLEKALLAALGVCGLAMVAGGSYYAISNNNNSNSPSGEEEFMKAGDCFFVKFSTNSLQNPDVYRRSGISNLPHRAP